MPKTTKSSRNSKSAKALVPSKSGKLPSRTTEKGAAAQKKRSKALTFSAKTADVHDLYQRSVQDAEAEVKFVERVFRTRGRTPLSLREDFCGTALMCSRWVSSNEERTAVGLDLDRDTLNWGRKHNIAPIGDAAERITLLEQDVCDEVGEGRNVPVFDATLALNFSYWVFKTRDAMRAYFKNVLRNLKDDGAFILDAYGGWESQEPMLEPRKIAGGFTYVWDQDGFDPITHDILNHIHFEFKDGTKIDRAFSYDWRFWSLPELSEILREAGFEQVEVWWDDTADEEEADYRPRKHVSNQPGWIAYIVATPKITQSEKKAASLLSKSRRSRGPATRRAKRG
jgi:SAM-dependent methyltransferase